MENNELKFKRVLLKLSGASFGKDGDGIDFKFLQNISEQIKEIKALGIDLSIVVGGGNIIRGRDAQEYGISQDQADKMGMVATMINAMALAASLENIDLKTQILNSFTMDLYGEDFSVDRANKYLANQEIVIYAGGTGRVGVTNDTNSAEKSLKTNCDVILKATDVDGVYDKDPRQDKSAKKYDELSYSKALDEDLRILDREAFEICQKSKTPIIVFDIYQENSISRVLLGEKIGTAVK